MPQLLITSVLQQTQAAIKAYRTAVNPRGRYRDDKLKQQAVACLDKYTLGDVANALLLDRKNIKTMASAIGISTQC